MKTTNQKRNFRPLIFEHFGNHHHAKIKVDGKTKKVSGGIIYNFSDNASALVEVKNRKLQGTFIHSGKTHRAKVDIKSDGSYGIEYKDSHMGGIELSIKGGKASLKRGKIPEAGLKINGNHHRLNLKIDSNKKLSGVVESKLTKHGSYRIKIENGKVTGGEFIHRGNNHSMTIFVSKEGYKFNYSNGKGKTRWGVSFEKMKDKIKAFGGLKFSF